MKLFGFSRNGFLYIDNGNNLILQETTSDESNMMNKYASLMEYDRFEDANAAYNSTLIHQALKPKLKNSEEEHCIISNMESGRVECKLVRKDDKYAYYTHIWALEGTKTPFIRKVELSIWNKHCFTVQKGYDKDGTKPKLSKTLTSIEKRFQEDAINQMYDEQEGYHTGF